MESFMEGLIILPSILYCRYTITRWLLHNIFDLPHISIKIKCMTIVFVCINRQDFQPQVQFFFIVLIKCWSQFLKPGWYRRKAKLATNEMNSSCPVLGHQTLRHQVLGIEIRIITELYSLFAMSWWCSRQLASANLPVILITHVEFGSVFEPNLRFPACLVLDCSTVLSC